MQDSEQNTTDDVGASERARKRAQREENSQKKSKQQK
jgi:hypothetical protein